MKNKLIVDDINDIEKRISPVKDQFQNKSIVITGGGGFLGSWLCEIFVNLNSTVFCIDNFSSGLRENIQHLEEKENFHLINADIKDFVWDKNCDFLIHLASRASPDDYQNNQVETLLTNSDGIYSSLEIAKKNNCKVLYASTSEVYGDPKIIPTPETYWGYVNSFGPRSCYDEGKRFGESLCYAYQNEYNLDVRTVRIFNTFGPRIRPDGPYGRALSRFILQAMKNEDITIYGDGLQTRSFCYVSDTLVGMILYLGNQENHGIINLGSEYEITINELASQIKEKLKSKSEIIKMKKSQDDPQKRHPDISKAKNVLNWKPEITFEEGLQKTIVWIENNKNTYF